jgi:hypothetical protein
MRILIGCNKSGREAMAFQALGWDAWTCDILPAEYKGNHIQDDVLKHLNDGWDMAIFNPDCTYLANSGVRWLFERPGRWALMREACNFFNKLLNAPISKIAIENPIQHKYARQYIRKPDQIIQPYHFGDKESKATCLWLKGLPPLIAKFSGGEGIRQSVYREPPSPERKANRARSFQGIAQAMAEQWGVPNP